MGKIGDAGLAETIIERYALDKSKPFNRRVTAMVQLASVGVLTTVPQLQQISLNNTKGMGSVAQEALERCQASLDGYELPSSARSRDNS